MNATATTLTITRRSRIGFAWTNSPERWTDHNGQSHLRIGDPGNEPQETGYVRAVYAEYQRVARLNNANDWTCRWFVLSGGEWVAVLMDTIELGWLADKTDMGDDWRSRPVNSIEAEVIKHVA